tara:strand:- start:80 stop:529 length:450 start_codon:yes stop_codon:yes gene_type:complete
MKKLTRQDKLFFLVTIFVIVVDQITKLVVRNTFELKQSLPVIKGFFHLTYTLNTGSGFSLLKDQNTALIWVSILILCIILYYYDKISDNKVTAISVALIVGGAIGNLIDRLILGGVIDFFDFIIWPVFNIADSAITIGVFILLIYLFRK